jgi:hypothetical protein
MFFEAEHNAKVLGGFLKKANASHLPDKTKAFRLSMSIQIIDSLYRIPKEWDEKCKFNIGHGGDNFIQLLRDFSESKSDEIDEIYSYSYMFLCEFDFLIGSHKQLGMELNAVKHKIQHDTDEIDDSAKSRIIYASYIMPAAITKEFLNDANIGVFKEFEQKKAEAEELKKEWDLEIETKKAETETIKNSLDTYKNAFNFVGLNDGFGNLATKKKNEAFWAFWSLIVMGFLILLPLILEMNVVASTLNSEDKIGINHLLVLIPLVSIEIILIYFFRIILINHRSVKAQIMQIELRQTLCQFIQNYADYSSEIKKKDASALEKFENLIFSGVLSDPEKLPSTFDGIEQIGNFIKSIKKSS